MLVHTNLKFQTVNPSPFVLSSFTPYAAHSWQNCSKGRAPVTHPSRCLTAAEKTKPLFGDEMCCPSCYVPPAHSWRTKLSSPAVPLIHRVGYELRTEWRAGTEHSTTFFSLPITTLSKASLPNLFHTAGAAVIATNSGTREAAVTARPSYVAAAGTLHRS